MPGSIEPMSSRPRSVMQCCLLALLIALAGIGGTPISAHAAQIDRCNGLAGFRDALLQVGNEWMAATTEAGVDYTADPRRFDAADWQTFAELAQQKHDRLERLSPPLWLVAWLLVEIDAAGMQSTAASAAAADGIEALHRFHDSFATLVERNSRATQAALDRCPSFASTNAAWEALDQDFQPAQPAASPAAAETTLRT